MGAFAYYQGRPGIVSADVGLRPIKALRTTEVKVLY